LAFKEHHMLLGRCRRFWLHGASIISQEQSIDGIGLGEPAPSPCKITGEARVDHADIDLGLMQEPDKRSVIRGCGLANDMNGRDAFADAFEQDLKPCRGIGDGCRQRQAKASKLKSGFGYIDSDDVDFFSDHG
jgi:hypothetical protein